MADLVEVLSTPDQTEARLAAAALTDLGLHPTVLGEGLASVLGAGQLAIPNRVMVPDNEAADARTAITAMRSHRPSDRADAPTECPDCGAPWEPGFDVCWRCDDAHGGPEAPAPAESAPTNSLVATLDHVASRVPRVPRPFDLGVLAASPVVVAALAAVDLLWVGVLLGYGLVWIAAAGFARTVEVRLDSHALSVGSLRVLWEEVERVRIGPWRIGWTHTDGTEQSTLVRLRAQDREALLDGVRRQLDRDRGARDRAAESAVRALVDR